jgi:hypothetical protein
MECWGCVCWNERGVELVGVAGDGAHIDVVAEDVPSEFQRGGYHCCDSCL